MDNPTLPAPIPPKPPISLNLAFLIITIISLFLSAFFIYQNWRLNQKLNALIKTQLQPTPLPAGALAKEGDPTSSWKTYVDGKYGFSINLPEYYQTENKSWTTDESVSYLSISPQPGSYEGCCFKKSDPISIGSKEIVMELYQNIGINDWKIKSRFATSHKFIKENVLTENGLSFTKFTALSLGQTGFADDDRLTGFFIQKGSTLIIISVNHFSENQNEAELFIDQILSTFKFVGQNVDQNIDDVFDKIRTADSTIRWSAVTTTDTFRYPAQNGIDLHVQKIGFIATGKEDFNKVNKIVDILKEDGWKLDNNNSASGVSGSYESYVKNIKGFKYLLVFGFNNSNIWFAMTKI